MFWSHAAACKRENMNSVSTAFHVSSHHIIMGHKKKTVCVKLIEVSQSSGPGGPVEALDFKKPKLENCWKLLKRQIYISHICVALLQCKPIEIFFITYCPSLCKNQGSGTLDSVTRTTEIGVSNFGCSRSFKPPGCHHPLQWLFVRGIFLYLMLSELSAATKNHCEHKHKQSLTWKRELSFQE